MLVTLLALPAIAQAVPLQLAHQGRLLDAEQAPLDGQHDLHFGFYDDAEDGTLLWDETVSETFVGGFYSTVLGADDGNPLDDGIFATPPVYLELTVDGGDPLLPRQEINSVPFALRAGTAENVDGGYVDARDVSIDGDLVIDADGNWVGPTPAVDWGDLSGIPGGLLDGEDADVLGGMSCNDGFVAKYDVGSSLWACGADEVLDSAGVLAFVDGAVINLGVGSSINGVEIATLDDLDWSMLTGVPTELADEEDADTLAALGPLCADGDRAAWDAGLGDWICAPEEIALDRLDTAGAATGQILTFDGTNVSWEDPVTATTPPCYLGGLSLETRSALFDCGSIEVRVPTLAGFSQLASGGSFSCGLLVDGTLTCWGADNQGQVSGAPGGVFTQVSAHVEDVCGVRGDGAVVCWGRDLFMDRTPPAISFTYVSAGRYHTCGLDGSGAAVCWGQDNYGQASPPAGPYSTLVAGWYHNCSLDIGGNVECWGWNDAGQATPPAGTFSQIDAGMRHTCGIQTGGAIQCWGITDGSSDDFGQVTDAPAAGTFVQLSVGDAHTCAVRTDGTVVCWGNNSVGQASPPASPFSQVSAGGDHTCGIVQATGVTWCWGGNSSGQASPP